MRFDLIVMVRDIYINSNLRPFTKFTGICRSTEFKDTLPWNISQRIGKTVPISMGIVKTGYLVLSLFENLETETKTRSEFPNGVKPL